jgi:hypothetical protein
MSRDDSVLHCFFQNVQFTFEDSVFSTSNLNLEKTKYSENSEGLAEFCRNH